MSSQQPAPFDWSEMTRLASEIQQSYQRLFQQRLANGSWTPPGDDLNLIEAFSEVEAQRWFDPAQIAERQMRLWTDSMQFWHGALLNWSGGSGTASETPPGETTDRRFSDEAWSTHPFYKFVKQAYLLAARHLYESVTEVDGVDPQKAAKAEFFTRQYIDAMSPSNFFATNPAVAREFAQSGGLSVLRGLRNLFRDLERGGGSLRISMTDTDAFELGKNVATTPGSVVYENDMMQLLQYAPSTAKVLRRPLLIVPPWINKYYILDLRAKNSFIKWAVDQGHTVFVISWVNPDASYADRGFDSYLNDGTLAALDAVHKASGVKDVNMIGYCLGGTLQAATLGYLAARQDGRVKSATFFASLTDFSDPGELGVFIDEAQLEALDRRMERGFLDGAEMATTFNMLRANDLVWSFFVNNYLLGKDPLAFDLLYWNSDSTRMPAAMHRFYLRNMYLHNRLREPGGIELNDTPIDLSKVKVPAYFLSTADDHIAPWQSTYAGAHLLGGNNRFVLGGSGHIAGVINPPNPDRPKYGYWTNDSAKLPPTADDWYRGAVHHEGSWWPDWQQWVTAINATKTAARQPGDGKLAIIEEAPGRYAKQRLA